MRLVVLVRERAHFVTGDRRERTRRPRHIAWSWSLSCAPSAPGAMRRRRRVAPRYAACTTRSWRPRVFGSWPRSDKPLRNELRGGIWHCQAVAACLTARARSEGRRSTTGFCWRGWRRSSGASAATPLDLCRPSACWR
eukprot:scaffold808_cov370-Prasinococcus_capsulatus_cf.AAC.3